MHPGAVLVAGGEEAERSITKSIQLRTSLKPYVMELAANATAHGTPLMVPLWWYFPDDPELQVRRTHQMPMGIIRSASSIHLFPRSETGCGCTAQR